MNFAASLWKFFGQRAGSPRLFFLHLPRTGGTALAKDILFPNFPRNRWSHVNYDSRMRSVDGADDPLSWPQQKRNRIRVVAGHMPVDLAQHFDGPCECITILRDPIRRTVSDYHYCRQDPCHPAHSLAKTLTLIEFVRGRYSTAADCYARWLSNEVFGAQFESEEEMFRAALQNLSQFAFIGLTEQFGSSLRWICARYRLANHATSEANRNPSTPASLALSEQEEEVLREHNLLDLKLYEYGKQLFRERTDELPSVLSVREV